MSLEFSNRRTSGQAGKIVQGCKPFTLILQLCSCGKIVASISTDLTPFVVTAMAKPDPEKSDFKAMGMAPGRRLRGVGVGCFGKMGKSGKMWEIPWRRLQVLNSCAIEHHWTIWLKINLSDQRDFSSFKPVAKDHKQPPKATSTVWDRFSKLSQPHWPQQYDRIHGWWIIGSIWVGEFTQFFWYKLGWPHHTAKGNANLNLVFPMFQLVFSLPGIIGAGVVTGTEIPSKRTKNLNGSRNWGKASSSWLALVEHCTTRQHMLCSSQKMSQIFLTALSHCDVVTRSYLYINMKSLIITLLHFVSILRLMICSTNYKFLPINLLSIGNIKAFSLAPFDQVERVNVGPPPLEVWIDGPY